MGKSVRLFAAFVSGNMSEKVVIERAQREIGVDVWLYVIVEISAPELGLISEPGYSNNNLSRLDMRLNGFVRHLYYVGGTALLLKLLQLSSELIIFFVRR